MTPAEMLKMAGGAIGALFFIFYASQVVYALVPLFAKAPARREPGMRRYAVLIAARNEEAVIARLIESIKDQDYPSELVSIFVVADNCTDSTAECARRAGAEVFERFDKVRAGKGYALSFLLARVHSEVIHKLFLFLSVILDSLSPFFLSHPHLNFLLMPLYNGIDHN